MTEQTSELSESQTNSVEDCQIYRFLLRCFRINYKPPSIIYFTQNITDNQSLKS